VPRLTSEFWVAAYLRRLALADIPVFVAARGDATAGNVMVKVNTLDGRACAYQRSFGADGGRVWIILAQGSDTEIESILARQRQFDRDIWILEVEDKAGRHLLDEPGFSE